MKRGLVSYRRPAEDPDDLDDPPAPVPANPTPSTVNINKTGPGSSSAPTSTEPKLNGAATETPQTSTAQTSPATASLLTHDDDLDLQPPQKKMKFDYSTWRTAPRPPGAHNPEVARFIAWSESGKSINKNLRSSKDFHNPSLLTNLVEMCGIQERGSNIPEEKRGLQFLPSDKHTALIEAQDALAKERSSAQQPGKRTQIDFVRKGR